MQSQQQQQQGVNFWKPAAIGTALLALAQLYEPVKDVYHVYFVDGYQNVESVPIAEQQLQLADRNAACFLEMQRSKVQVNDHLDISYGACPNDNVHVVVYPKNRSAFQRWLEPNQEQSGGKQAGSLISSAYAAMAANPAIAGQDANSIASTRVQMVLKTVCQNWHNAQRTKIVRITNEGGQCYFERVNVLSGIVEVRETVPCESQCETVAKKFN
jgi:hypothetical protein